LKGGNIVFAHSTSVDFLGFVNFKGPRYEDGDVEHSVTFQTEVLFEQDVLFEEDVEFDSPALFTDDVTMEGPNAPRTIRRMRGDRQLAGSSDKDGDTTFNIIGNVNVEIESENEVYLQTETYFDNDVHIGDDDYNRRIRRLSNKNQDKAKLYVNDLDVIGGVLVEGRLDAGGDALFHGDLVYEDETCMVDCTVNTGNSLCHDL
jgi:hypothetical protein